MASVLQQIATPLQLAALFLLLLAGVARLLVRSGKISLSPGLSRMLINRVFALALVALVLGLVLPSVPPMLDRLGGGDPSFHGAVLSTAGTPVPGATVNLPTITAGVTNALGQFDVTVPRERRLPQYRVEATAPGFKPSGVLVHTAAEMRSLEIRLEPETRALVRRLEQPVLAGQLFGLPFTVATLEVVNPAPTVALITDVRATLVGPGASFTLNPTAWTVVGQWGPYAPIGMPLPFFAGARVDLRLLLMLPGNVGAMLAQVAALPEYRQQPACTALPGATAPPLTDAAFAIVRDFATQRFVWAPGDWRLHLDLVADGQLQSFDAPFTLSAADVDLLRDSIALTRQCQGVNLGNPLAQDGARANFLAR